MNTDKWREEKGPNNDLEDQMEEVDEDYERELTRID
jgi:hypothetical protein